MKKQLLDGGKIWDLHIHSCKCKSCNPSIAVLGTRAYIDALSDIFKRNPLVEMISFTDRSCAKGWCKGRLAWRLSAAETAIA
jgi:hypothetical protein